MKFLFQLHRSDYNRAVQQGRRSRCGDRRYLTKVWPKNGGRRMAQSARRNHGLSNCTYLHASGLISDTQWGFCPGKSTVTALLSTFHAVFKMLEMGSDVSLVFFNLRKAFDSVPHTPLLQHLKDIGLNSHILQWISSYLCCRKQYVVVEGASSSTTSVPSGVP